MRVEQAIYGETLGGGHALRLASNSNRIAAELTSRLDLPDTAPSGIEWSPYLSGFPYADRYVLARTYADPRATRAGMVLSHAIIAPLEEMAATADLRPLLEMLITSPEAPDFLHDRDVPSSTEPPLPAVDLVPAAQELVARRTGHVVRLGIQGFESLAASLWFCLWPELRVQFAFRLSFGPADIIETLKPSLVCTPAALASRWFGHRVIGTASQEKFSRAVSILTGGPQAEPLHQFKNDIGASIERLVDLSLLESAYERWSSQNPTVSNCVELVRLVEPLSPDPAMGAEEKERIIHKLASQLDRAEVADVLRLRNLRTTGFRSADVLWAGLKSWVSANRFAESDDTAMLSAVGDALSASAAVEPWRTAILDGIVAASRSSSSAFPIAFWRWTQESPETLKGLVEHLPIDRDLEQRLSEAAPRQVSTEAGTAVMSAALSKQWLRLHGTAVSASFPPRDAVRRQLAIDLDPLRLEGMRAALRCTLPTDLLAIALEIAEPRITSIAAKAVALEPQLLNVADFNTAVAQAIWAEVLTINVDAWRGPNDPQRSFYTVIESLLDGRPANAELIAKLSATPIADLSGFPRRAEVWTRLQNPDRRNLLRTTALGWIDRASSGSAAYAPDRELETAVLSEDRLDICVRSIEIWTALRVISALPQYDERRFLSIVEYWLTARQFANSDAEAIGRFICDRQWRLALERLITAAKGGRPDVKPALRICSDMINAFLRWMLGLSAVTINEKWTILEEVLTCLYPQGPEQHGIWNRADGREADLQSYGSGWEKWRDAIMQMRHGKGPRPARLLDAVLSEFPRNDQVQYLARDPDFGGGGYE